MGRPARSRLDVALFDTLRKTAREGRRQPTAPATRSRRSTGRRTALEATYTVAYIAHAPLEPRAAVAEWQGGKLTVWTGTQRPFGVRDELARTFGLKPEDVRVLDAGHGSGYGGKHTGEAAIEAARLARAAGKPVSRALDPRGGVHLGLLPPRRVSSRCAPASTRTAS